MKTVAERWAEASREISTPPGPVRAALRLSFYAGYAACLKAAIGLADLPKDQAVDALLAQSAELLSAEAAAQRETQGGCIQ